jgi:hypothetical protein
MTSDALAALARTILDTTSYMTLFLAGGKAFEEHRH